MRKHLLVASVALALAAFPFGAAMAANPDTGPGCGLGKLAWGSAQHQKDIAPQVLMATTNGTFWSQTFGISFGTSGCTNSGKVMSEQRTAVFASLNFENLSQEMAQGEGEHMASLATLMGIPADRHPEFFAMAQSEYRNLVQAGETSPLALVRALNEAASAHPALAQVETSR